MLTGNVSYMLSAQACKVTSTKCVCFSSYLQHHGGVGQRQLFHNVAVTVLHHGLVLTGAGGQLFCSSSLSVSLSAPRLLVLVFSPQAVSLHAAQEGGQSRRQFVPWPHMSSSVNTSVDWRFTLSIYLINSIIIKFLDIEDSCTFCNGNTETISSVWLWYF